MQTSISRDLDHLVQFESRMRAQEEAADEDVMAEVRRNLERILQLGDKISVLAKHTTTTGEPNSCVAENPAPARSLKLDDVQAEVRSSVRRIEDMMGEVTAQLGLGQTTPQAHQISLATADRGAQTVVPKELLHQTPPDAYLTSVLEQSSTGEEPGQESGALLVAVVEATGLGPADVPTGHYSCYAVVEVSPTASRRTSVTLNSGSEPRWNDGNGEELLFDIGPDETTGTIIVTMMNAGSVAGNGDDFIGHAELSFANAPMGQRCVTPHSWLLTPSGS